MMLYNIIFYSFLFVLLPWSQSPKAKLYEVRWAGKLSDILVNNDASAHANLDTMQGKPSLYGFGNAENLNGEILILNGKAIDVFINPENKFDFNERYNIKAANLTYTMVKTWDEVKIPQSIRTMKQFEEFLLKKTVGLPEDPDEPFPFLLKCEMTNLKFRVAKGKGKPKPPKNQYVPDNYYGKLSNKRVVMLGFYSKKHKNIFTDEDKNMSIYFISSDKSAIGKVDDFTLIDGALLALPVN